MIPFSNRRCLVALIQDFAIARIFHDWKAFLDSPDFSCISFQSWESSKSFESGKMKSFKSSAIWVDSTNPLQKWLTCAIGFFGTEKIHTGSNLKDSQDMDGKSAALPASHLSSPLPFQVSFISVGCSASPLLAWHCGNAYGVVALPCGQAFWFIFLAVELPAPFQGLALFTASGFQFRWC